MSSAGQRRNIHSGLRTVSNSSKLTFNNSDDQQQRATSSKTALETKEEEYKRLNEELEKKTANLVFEAEQALKANERLIHETDYLNKIGEVNFMDNEIETKNYSRASFSGQRNQNQSAHSLINKRELSQFKETINDLQDNSQENNDDFHENEMINEYNEIEDGNEIDDDAGGEEHNHASSAVYRGPSGTGSTKDVKRLVERIVESDDRDSNVNGLIPSSANEMSSTAQIRFLKAKLKVMQEEVDRFSAELTKKDEENAKLAQRCKELDEDRAKQLRISNSHQTSLDKVKRQSEDQQLKLNAAEIQLGALKKENDNLKKDTKKSSTDHQQLELRLSRALEEIDKYKAQAQKLSANTKDATDAEKRRVEQLTSENKRLQKQKTELIQAFKKQLKLIDILKKQKMHLEAAKILQFAEEEFINALEWNSTNAGFGTSGQQIDSKPGSKQNSFRGKTDPPHRQQQPGIARNQRPPSGNSRVTNQKNNQQNSKAMMATGPTTSMSSGINGFYDGEKEAEKGQRDEEPLMLDNLDYLDYDDVEGDNYYKMEQTNEDFNDNDE